MDAALAQKMWNSANSALTNMGFRPPGTTSTSPPDVKFNDQIIDTSGPNKVVPAMQNLEGWRTTTSPAYPQQGGTSAFTYGANDNRPVPRCNAA